MVLTTIIRQSATKRIPLIKFRRQREQDAASARSSDAGSAQAKGSVGGAGVSKLHALILL